MNDIKPELIEKATSAVRHERAYIAAAAFGVPLDSVGECAGMIAHAVLSAVADDLRAEGAAQAREQEHRAPTVRHRDAITGEYVTADEAAARPETTVRETRKP